MVTRLLQKTGLWIAVLVVSVWSLGVGASDFGMGAVWHAVLTPDMDRVADVIFWSVRLPRVLIGLAVGAALAGAGVILQAVTGNPLAEPGLLGVNSGAAFAIVIATVVTGSGLSMGASIWLGFAGSGGAAFCVFMLAGPERAGGRPLRLILAGVVVASFTSTVTMALLMLDLQALDAVRLWTAGSLKNRGLGDVLVVLPYLGLGLFLALLLRTQVTALSFGPDNARSFGQNTVRWRAVALGVATVLAGASVALAGPIGFVGLIVPHMVRLIRGGTSGDILPDSLLVGAALTVLADTVPRAVNGTDIPVGITLAVLGAPFFIWLARRPQAAAP